jgi:hypothetical protein
MRPKAYNADLERYTYSAQQKKKKRSRSHQFHVAVWPLTATGFTAGVGFEISQQHKCHLRRHTRFLATQDSSHIVSQASKDDVVNSEQFNGKIHALWPFLIMPTLTLLTTSWDIVCCQRPCLHTACTVSCIHVFICTWKLQRSFLWVQ